MTQATIYPPADAISQWYGPGNATVSPTKLLWHTTETAGGWPGYSGGDQAPNLTYDPWTHLWRQHFPLNGSARALANAGSYQTNRAAVCQVEVSCYCDPARFPTGFGVDRLDDHAYDDLGGFAVFMLEQWGIPLASTVGWKPYPASYGAGNGVRLSTSAFTSYRGHLSHMHAPGNDHGDAGQIDITRILSGGDSDMTPAQAESLEECRRMLGVVLGALVPAAGEHPVGEDASEARRMAGVLLAAIPPAAGEQTIAEQVGTSGGGTPAEPFDATITPR